ALLPTPAIHAQATGGFPSRPIRLVVAFAPGGNSDTLARLIQPRMAAVLGQGIVIDNRGGAGGTLAAGAVAAAPADGHTLLFDAASFVVAQFIHRSTPFDYERDFAPVGLVAEVPYVLAVATGTGIRDVKGFLDKARATRDGLSYGSPGVGSPGHLAGVLLAHRAGVRLEHVPYRGGADVARDLAAGRIDACFISHSSLKPVLEAGRGRLVAVTSAGRRPLTPEVPALGEALPGYDLLSWTGVFAPAGTPSPALRRFAAAARHAVADPTTRERLLGIGNDPAFSPPEDYAALIRRDREVARGIVAASPGLRGS
ncbi:MAG: twin-arginine translocation pathway signal protein, partial [Acetobacteraceae bacterium]|nr:twin-arginine translocation pathway signal protein [Acetobacteraceae bacterium]